MTASVEGIPIRIGSVIGGRYVLRRLLGEGGMGQVFEAEHMALGRSFALKLLRLSPVNDELVQRFQREARALARIATPRVAQITDFGVEGQTGPFYVMELLDGETLEERIEREGSLPVEDVRAIAIGLCEALEEVHHAGIIHRDLKPSNIGLPRSGPVAVKLLDFGLASSIDDTYLARITQSQQIVGSIPYMAPEQFDGARPTLATDLYSLGVVIFEALGGRLPFVGPSTAALIHQILCDPPPSLGSNANKGVPRDLEDLIRALLEKDASKRPRSATEVKERLAGRAVAIPPTVAMPYTEIAASTGGLPPTAPMSQPGFAEAPLPRKRAPVLATVVIVGIMLALVAVAGVVMFFLSTRDIEPPPPADEGAGTSGTTTQSEPENPESEIPAPPVPVTEDPVADAATAPTEEPSERRRERPPRQGTRVRRPSMRYPPEPPAPEEPAHEEPAREEPEQPWQGEIIDDLQP